MDNQAAAFLSQYASVYFNRLKEARKFFAGFTVDGYVRCDRICQLQRGTDSAVCGTVFAPYRKLPTSLQDCLEGKEPSQQVTESLFLEDETARITLVPGKGLTLKGLITGMVVCVCGQLSASRVLQVQSWHYPPIGPCSPLKTRAKSPSATVLLSDLAFDNADLILSRTRMRDWLCSKNAKVDELIILGPMFQKPPKVSDIVAADTFMATLGSSIPKITVVTGEKDSLTAGGLPQHPYPPSVLPFSYAHGTISVRSNATSWRSDPTGDLIGTSTLPSTSTPIGTLVSFYRSRLVCPVAPDLMTCTPGLVSSLVWTVDDTSPSIFIASEEGASDICVTLENSAVIILLPSFARHRKMYLLRKDGDRIRRRTACAL